MSESDSEEFSWSKAAEEGDLAVHSVDAIAVYRNPRGDIVIRQQDRMGDEDAIVVIPQAYLEGFIVALRNIN